MWTDPGKILIAHRYMNVEIWTEAAQFPEKEYIDGIFAAVWLAFTLSNSTTQSCRFPFIAVIIWLVLCAGA
jgi:hypothetical protein